MSEVAPHAHEQGAPAPNQAAHEATEPEVGRNLLVAGWLERAGQRERLYVGVEGLRTAIQIALDRIDPSLKITIEQGSTDPRSYLAHVSCDGLVVFTSQFYADQTIAGYLKNPGITPEEMCEKAKVALAQEEAE